MIYYDGNKFDDIEAFDCISLSFSYKEGGSFFTCLPISSAEHRKENSTKAHVEVQINDTRTVFSIWCDWGRLSEVSVDNHHQEEIISAINSAFSYGLIGESS